MRLNVAAAALLLADDRLSQCDVRVDRVSVAYQLRSDAWLALPRQTYMTLLRSCDLAARSPALRGRPQFPTFSSGLQEEVAAAQAANEVGW